MVFGFCNNKCKHEVYTKDEVDTKLTDWKLKGDFAVLTGDITLESTGGSANVNYPEGFTKDNCVIIACGIIYNSGGYRAFGTVQASVSTGARLNTNSITVGCYPVQSNTGSPTGTFNYKLVLMKV